MDKRIRRTVAYLLRCPRLTVLEAMRACKISDKESKDARKQMAAHRADSNTTTNQKKGSAKVGGGCGCDRDCNGSGNDGNATTRRRCNDATTNQRRDQQRWEVVVAAVATATAAATTETTAT